MKVGSTYLFEYGNGHGMDLEKGHIIPWDDASYGYDYGRLLTQGIFQGSWATNSMEAICQYIFSFICEPLRTRSLISVQLSSTTTSSPSVAGPFRRELNETNEGEERWKSAETPKTVFSRVVKHIYEHAFCLVQKPFARDPLLSR